MVVFSGGGTGGHLYPALAIADALRERRPDVRALFLGATRGIEARVLPERGEWHVLFPVRGLDRSSPVGSLAALWGLMVAMARTARLFQQYHPEAVVVTGGYAGAAAGLVAGMSGATLVLQEQNSVPGAVTKLLTRWARRIHVAFPEAVERLPMGRERAWVTGNPVRPTVAADRSEVRARYGLPDAAPVVVIAGGSQGSLALNRVLAEAVRGVQQGTLERPAELRLLWSTGTAHYDAVSDLLREAGSPEWVIAVDYIHDMPSVLAAADLAVSRAGAMSTAELLNQGVPAVLVPYPFAAANHQMRNARALERAGAVVVAPESELGGESLWRELVGLLGAPERLERMRDAALGLARPHAAADIAADVISFLPEPGALR